MRNAALLLVAAALGTTGSLLGLVSGSAFGQYDPGVVSSYAIRRHGLIQRWQAHAEIDRSRARIGHVHHHVSATNVQVLYEVRFDDQVREFSERTLDPFGVPIGKEGAKAQASEFLELLTKSGRKATVAERIVPETTLYVVSDRALVHAIDAETGRTRWTAGVGRHDFPTLAAGANDGFVAMVNGSTLYVLNSFDGKLAWERSLSGAPGAGPAVSRERVFVPLVNGIIESHPVLFDRRPPVLFQAHGRTLVQPVVSPLSVAWPTERGFVYVGNADYKGVRYRLEAFAEVVCQPALAPAPDRPGRLFACSLDGYIYCLDEMQGSELWRFSTGEPISRTPIVLGDQVLVITDDFNMFGLGVSDAKEHFYISGVRGFVAASAERIYCIGQTAQMLVLDRKTGARLGEIPIGPLDLIVPNILTDRIFLGDRRGIIQCLHEPANVRPLVHVAMEVAPPPGPQVEQKPAGGPMGEQPPMPMPMEGADPFGGAGGANPFGGGNDAANPFGPAPGGGGAAPGAGDANPFGGGNDAANPFGPAPAGGAAPANPGAVMDNNPFGNG